MFAKMNMIWGGGLVFFWVLATAFIGMKLVQHQQRIMQPHTIMQLQQQGRFHPLMIPMSIIRIIASFLLMIPGFFTDSIAIAMYFPPITMWLANRFMHKLSMQQLNRWMPSQNQQSQHNSENESWGYTSNKDPNEVIIEVEGRVVDESDD
jgi:UPF0716 family protein affecting phage T7 exclusion